MHGLPSPERLEKSHQLALVIGRSARANDLALGRVLQFRIKGVAVPKRQRINGLHVVMAIEQQMRPAGSTMGHHHRMARCGAGAGVKPQGFQILDQPIGGASAIGLEGRISGNRRDPQQRHQTLQRLRQGIVYLRKHGLKRHLGLSGSDGRGRAYQAFGDCPEGRSCATSRRKDHQPGHLP